jgi:hypothetical protein
MADYVASKIFNGLKPDHFDGLMNEYGIDLTVPEGATKTPGEILAQEWHSLLKSGETQAAVASERKRLRGISGLHDFLQRLHNLTEGKCDAMKLARDLAESAAAPFDLPDEFETWSPYDRGAYVFLNNETLWENLCNLSLARNRESSRLWIDYYGLPAVSPNASLENIDALEKMLIEHFKESKRSESCKVDSYIRRHQYYFFATLCDSPRYDEVQIDSLRDITGANSGKEVTAAAESSQGFDFVPLVHPFRIIFAYDESGQFSIYGELAKSDFDILATKLVKALVGFDGKFKRVPKNAYCLDGLKDRNFDFKIESADNIESIKVTALTFCPVDDEHTRMSVANRRDDIYDRLEQYLNRERLDNDSIDLLRATLAFKMRDGFRAFRAFSFDIALNSCGTKSLEDRQRELGEKYIRKLAFIRFPDITLNSILKAAKADIPVISNKSFGCVTSPMLRNMLDFGLIVETGEATQIRDGDATYEVVTLTNENGESAPGYMDAIGHSHLIDPLELKHYRIVFDPVVQCIRDELNCKGDANEVLSGRVWHLGFAGSEHRDAYLVRNWNCDAEVRAQIKLANPGSLIFYLGRCPEVVEIGTRRSDAEEDAQRLEAQFYRADTLIEYTQEAGYVFRAETVRQKLKSMQEAFGAKSCRNKRLLSKQERYQQKLETRIWVWIDARLKAAKAVTDYTGEPDPDVNPAWLSHEYLTQKQVCDEEGIDDVKAFTRAKAAWKKDLTGYGVLYYKVTERFIVRQPRKDKANDGLEAERLNDFYRENREIINALRRQRPHYL